MATLPIFMYTSTLVIFLYYFLRHMIIHWHRKPLPPGPKPWPIIGNLVHIGDKPHQTMTSMAGVYGPLMHLKMGFVHVIVAASASVAEQLLKVHGANFSNRPPSSGGKHIAYDYHDLVFAPYGPRWRTLRKICAVHLFTGRALDDYRHVRQEEVAIFAQSLASAHGKSLVNLGQSLNVCSTNTMARMTIGWRLVGYGIHGGVDAKAEEFKSMVVELMTLAGLFNIGDFIPPLEVFDLQGLAKKMKRVHKRFDALLNKILEEHKLMHNASRNVDLLSTLIGLNNVEHGNELGKLTDTDIKALLLNLLSAGTDTSSSTIEWALVELIRHPSILTRAQQELDSVVGKNRLVTEADLSQLTFLQAIVKETFRLHPATPLSLPRMANENCEINGYFIPKGSTLLVNIWAIGRDPNVWTDPLEFRPERFLLDGERPNVDVQGNHFEVIPFGAGRRICVGMRLGLRMVQFITATLIHAFDFELPDGLQREKLDMEEEFGISLQRAVPLLVHPMPRLAPHVIKC
ncbi:Cytochrome P450 [Orobanche gracilis]